MSVPHAGATAFSLKFQAISLMLAGSTQAPVEPRHGAQGEGDAPQARTTIQSRRPPAFDNQGREEGEVERGSPRLRARKLALTMRDDVEMTGPGILFGHELLDRYQYDTLGYVTLLLRRIARSFGRDVSPSGVWAALLAAASRTPPGAPVIIGDYGARDTLARICRRLDGSRDLVLELAAEGSMPLICVRVVERRLTPRDAVQLELLRKGLDGISSPSRTAEDD
jgi:hypothetical protein